MKKKWNQFRTLGNLVQNYFLKNVPGPFLLVSYLRDDWGKIVGKGIAHHSLPFSIRQNTLTVHVDDPIWIQELSLQKDAIMENIQGHYPDRRFHNIIRTVKFKIGEIRDVPKPEEKNTELLLDQETMKKIEAAVSGVDDPKLKGALKHYFIAAELDLREQKIDEDAGRFDAE